MNSYCSIGLKVLAAVGVGAAVFFGLDKVVSSKKSSQPKEGESRVKQPKQSNQQNFQQDSWDNGNKGTEEGDPQSGESLEKFNPSGGEGCQIIGNPEKHSFNGGV